MTTPPDDLRAAGQGLWRRLHADASGRSVVLEPHELAALHAACRLEDTAADLAAAVERDGLMVAGSREQTIVNPAAVERRLALAEQGRLLRSIDWPDEAPATTQRRRRNAS